MANTLTLFCLINGELTSNAFPAETSSDKTVGVLKDLIKAKRTVALSNVDANELTLWLAVIPDNRCGSAITIGALDGKTKLSNPRRRLSQLFSESPDEETYILVQRPAPVPKRDRDEGDIEDASKKARTESNPVLRAIRDGKLEHGIIKGLNLSVLNSQERVKVLGHIGTEVAGNDRQMALSKTANALRNSSFQKGVLISSATKTSLPVTNSSDLYVRQAYKDFYDEIGKTFNRIKVRNHVALTGTPGIGKSAFLVYFIIRILATSKEDSPPIIIFEQKEGTKCYAFGGLSTVRRGDQKDFDSFLDLPETWYLVDSSPNPSLPNAKTIIAVPAKTLFSETCRSYKEIDKRLSWYYYMAPWTLEELEICRRAVKDFERISKSFLKELYGMIGGVPEYVLERPNIVLLHDRSAYRLAKERAYEPVKRTLDNLQNPLKLMQYISSNSLEYSGCLLHRWPKDKHSGFDLEWGSIWNGLRDMLRRR